MLLSQESIRKGKSLKFSSITQNTSKRFKAREKNVKANMTNMLIVGSSTKN